MIIPKHDQLNPIVVPLASSKSESNRVLMINALSKIKSDLTNLSSARDTRIMTSLLESDSKSYDVHDAGTVMRFLTAFLALLPTESTIKGTERMHQRPIGLLVDALRSLGADISYMQQEGFPPLSIQGITNQIKSEIDIPGNVSSQYISALLMIAPCLPKGLKINLIGAIYSLPYINMTLVLMKKFGVENTFENNSISVKPQEYGSHDYHVESDWSGASYWFSMVALAEGSTIQLSGLREESLQGDSAIVEIMAGLGVNTTFFGETVKLSHQAHDDYLEYDFKNCPDLAQTVIAAAAAKKIELKMTGLESLKIKETDRVAAMSTEVSKIGAVFKESETGVWTLTFEDKQTITEPIEFDTYEDHRMAMALAPLSLKYDIKINDPDVVKKSYPEYWDHMKLAGFMILEQ